MGNIIFFWRKKPAITEELDELSTKTKQFREDIVRVDDQRRAVLWYSTLSIFFAVSTGSAYVVLKYNSRREQILYALATISSGVALLYAVRRFTNTAFGYRVQRKQKALDDLIERKKTILENVKETQTFKVAKEILDKYEDSAERLIPAATPAPSTDTPRPPAPNQPGMAANMDTPRAPPGPRPGPSTGIRGPVPILGPNGPGGIHTQGPGQRPMGPSGPRPPPRRPVQPFVKESKAPVDKIIDYFFGDGPNHRYALICTNCHGHNGMAMPGEFEYLAFQCYMCGMFNPARKLRPSMSAMASLGTRPSLPGPAPPVRPPFRPVDKKAEESSSTESEQEPTERSEGSKKDDKDDTEGSFEEVGKEDLK